MPLPVNIHLWIPRNKYPRNDQSQDAEEFPGGLAVKDLALSLLWLGFSLWPGNFGRLQAQPKKKKKNTDVIYAFPFLAALQHMEFPGPDDVAALALESTVPGQRSQLCPRAPETPPSLLGHSRNA